MALEVKVPAASHEDLSSSPRTHMVALRHPHACGGLACACPHTQNKLKHKNRQENNVT